MKAWRLDGPGVTLLCAAEGDQCPRCIYWGLGLPKDEAAADLVAALQPAQPNARIDTVPPLSLSPEARRGWFGVPGIELANDDGPVLPDFKLISTTTEADSLAWIVEDSEIGIALSFTLSVDQQIGALKGRVRLSATKPVDVAWLSAPVLPIPSSFTETLDFAGRWTGEFRPQRRSIEQGLSVRESREGRTGHASPPYVAFLEPGTTKTAGTAFAMQSAWHGAHRILVEELSDGRRQVQMGARLAPGEGRVEAGGSLESPAWIAAVSDSGLGGTARIFHQATRAEIVKRPEPRRPLPVHYNCWEAIYFDHDLQTLREIADRAAALGAERFVLDDGWFKGRSDDHRALGDWSIDAEKYPDGLTPLIDHVERLGMRFGLWVEPEMINVDSDLHRKHPDWVLGGPAANQPEGRHQYVLDMANPDVLEHTFAWLDGILRGHRIDYLKWDHNRPIIGATQAQGHAVDGLFARVREAHPGVEIESCSGGGGRIDLGILEHTHRVWLSDSNDALVRLAMQHNAALMIPTDVTGSHVGPRVCHTSGRELPMAFRAWVAAQRHMGFEMDPRELTDQEAETLARITDWWKRNRDWLRSADLFPLDSADPALISELHLSADGDRFVGFVGFAADLRRAAPPVLKPAGLDPKARYRVRLHNPEDVATRINAAPCGLVTAAENGLVLSGAALMQAGLALPICFPATMLVLEGKRLDSAGA